MPRAQPTGGAISRLDDLCLASNLRIAFETSEIDSAILGHLNFPLGLGTPLRPASGPRMILRRQKFPRFPRNCQMLSGEFRFELGLNMMTVGPAPLRRKLTSYLFEDISPLKSLWNLRETHHHHEPSIESARAMDIGIHPHP